MHNGLFFRWTSRVTFNCFSELKFFRKSLAWLLRYLYCLTNNNVITADLETLATNGKRKKKPTPTEINERFVWDFLSKSKAI